MAAGEDTEKREDGDSSAGKPMRRVLQVALGVSLGVVATLLVVRSGPGPAGPPADEHMVVSPYPAPPLVLTAHTGEQVSLEELDDRVNVVFFGYTHCPDVCPATMAALTRAVELLGERGQRIRGLLVTVDPVRDSVARLADYMESFHPSFLGLTGTEEEIRAVAEAWGIFHQRAALAADSVEGGGAAEAQQGYLVDHSARSFVVAPDGRIHMTFPPGTSATEMAESLGRLLDLL